MESGVGARLRDARKRRDLDLNEVEAAIKIRVRYLRAIEDEDWEVLPGDVYARGFIRTYASHLGLDGERLAAEYGAGAGAHAQRAARGMEPADGLAPRQRRLSGRVLVAVAAIAMAGAFVAVEGLLG